MTNLARRRYQRGSLRSADGFWRARWREDVLLPAGTPAKKGDKAQTNGTILRRIHHNEIIGTMKEFPTKRLAQRELDRRLAEVNREDYKPTISSTFESFASRWQEKVMVHHKPSARDSERSILRCHLLPAFGRMALRDITAESVQSFVTNWSLGPKTLSNVVTLLMGMWDTAKGWGYVQHSPFPRGSSGRLLLQMPKQVKGDTYNFTLEETLAIIAAAEGKWKLFFRAAAESGMRPGELAGVKRDGLAGRCLNVSQSVYRGHLQTPKTKSAVRSFAISQDLADELREYLDATAGERNTYGLMWTSSVGGPLHMQHVRDDILNPILEKLGIRAKLDALGLKGGFYPMRHMNMTELRRRGVPLATIQKRVGHAPGTDVADKHYVHPVEADDLAASDLLGELLRPKDTNEVVQ